MQIVFFWASLLKAKFKLEKVSAEVAICSILEANGWSNIQKFQTIVVLDTT